LNIQLARQAFGTSYVQNNYGLNVRSRDPQYASRIEPPRDWTGVRLVRNLIEQNPFNQMYSTLLRQATWQDHIREACDWLVQLKKSDAVSERQVLAEDARIHFAARDLGEAERLAQQAQAISDNTDTQELLSRVQMESRFIWNPTFLYQSDDRDRQDWVFQQTLSTWGFGNALWSLHHVHGSYQENGVPTVTQDGVGLGADHTLGLFHRLSWSVIGQHLSGNSDQTTCTGSAAFRSRWTDTFESNVEGGRALYDTASALNAGVTDRFVRLTGDWNQDGGWRINSKARFGDLSDGNKRYIGEFEVTRRLFVETDLRLGYHFEAEHYDTISPSYYSPRHLVVHQAVLQYAVLLAPEFEFEIRYLPGTGDEAEKTTSTQFVQDLEVALPFALGKHTTVSPEVWLTRTPSYSRNTYNVALKHRF
jgi:hypothetical protein